MLTRYPEQSFPAEEACPEAGRGDHPAQQYGEVQQLRPLPGGGILLGIMAPHRKTADAERQIERTTRALVADVLTGAPATANATR